LNPCRKLAIKDEELRRLGPKEGSLSQWERCFLTAKTALVLPIAGYLPFRKGLPAFLKAFMGSEKAFYNAVKACNVINLGLPLFWYRTM